MAIRRMPATRGKNEKKARRRVTIRSLRGPLESGACRRIMARTIHSKAQLGLLPVGCHGVGGSIRRKRRSSSARPASRAMSSGRTLCQYTRWAERDVIHIVSDFGVSFKERLNAKWLVSREAAELRAKIAEALYVYAEGPARYTAAGSQVALCSARLTSHGPRSRRPSFTFGRPVYSSGDCPAHQKRCSSLVGI